MTCRVRKITLYETESRFYLVGCDLSGQRHNILKIDRIDSKAIVTGEPEHDYSEEDVKELLSAVSEGNSIVSRTSASGKKGRPSSGIVARVYNAFSVLGVVRFLEGYYLILITKAHVIASFGYHSVFKVAEVAMISLASEDHTPSAEELRYVKQFQSVDLSTDFYFSYSYDLSRSLQENVMSTDWGAGGARVINSDKKFVWNKFLLQPLRNNLVSERWFVEVVHGFVRQQVVELPCSKLLFVLIGRRSADYAGTRYLKRGANLNGDVANDVETEQIVWDIASSPQFNRGRFSAFVQRRGSVPLRWSQDPATRGVVGKPLILIGIHEPHAQTAAAHLRQLKKKYGDPVVVMNLVKRREKRRHESILHHQFLRAVNYLNEFVPAAERVCYVSFDVARCNKKTAAVLPRLEELGERVLRATSWFQTFQSPYARKIRGEAPSSSPFSALSSSPLSSVPSSSSAPSPPFQLQSGVCRTNCVDCLDRTNVAQFGIGKVALAHQLVALGVLEEPSIQPSSEVCRVLEELWDDHGDTMALQYAGSQLVHSIKTYKKTAAFQERSRDVIQTLSRYYSNTFGDYDKQAAINLFLGMFRPKISSILHLWDLPSDLYLHMPPSLRVDTDYCSWWAGEDSDSPPSLAFSPNNGGTTPTLIGNCRENFMLVGMRNEDDFREFYRTFELTALEGSIKQAALQEIKLVSVNSINQEASSTNFIKLFKSDAKSGAPSKKTSKAGCRESEDEDEDVGESKADEDTVVEEDLPFETLLSKTPSNSLVDIPPLHENPLRRGLMTGLESSRERYGVDMRDPPSSASVHLYESYVKKAAVAVPLTELGGQQHALLLAIKAADSGHLRPFFTTDTACHTELPEVSERCRAFYVATSSPSHSTSERDLAYFYAYPQFPIY